MIKLPSLQKEIPIEPLTAAAFAPFGSVLSNPAHGNSSVGSQPAAAANQGTATKYGNITDTTNFYHLSPNKRPAKAMMSMFICQPRTLREGHLFDVDILERHPYTSQTFVPLGLPAETTDTEFLIIVAPSLSVQPGGSSSYTSQPPTRRRSLLNVLRKARPAPFTNDAYSVGSFPQMSDGKQIDPEPTARRRSLSNVYRKARPAPFTNEALQVGSFPQRPDGKQTLLEKRAGPGLPDLTNLKAFRARGDQAVTYNAATWHAPMAVIGVHEVSFIVSQWSNGVAGDDVQECELTPPDGQAQGLVVDTRADGRPIKAKL